MVRARRGPCEESGDPAGRDDANSYLPFTGRLDLKQAVSARVADRSGVTHDPEADIVVTATEGDALLDVLLALTDPGRRDRTNEVVIICRAARGEFRRRSFR